MAQQQEALMATLTEFVLAAVVIVLVISIVNNNQRPS